MSNNVALRNRARLFSDQRQGFEQSAVNQILKVTADRESECVIPDEDTEFDISIQSSLCQVRRSDKDRLIVSYNGFCVENTARTIGVKRSSGYVSLDPR